MNLTFLPLNKVFFIFLQELLGELTIYLPVVSRRCSYFQRGRSLAVNIPPEIKCKHPAVYNAIVKNGMDGILSADQ